MRSEANRILNFLAGFPGGHSTMSRKDAHEMLLSTGGNILACGTLYDFVLKDLGADVYRVSLTPSYKGPQLTAQNPASPDGELVSIQRCDLIELKQLVGIVQDMQEAKETLPLLGRIQDALSATPAIISDNTVQIAAEAYSLASAAHTPNALNRFVNLDAMRSALKAALASAPRPNAASDTHRRELAASILERRYPKVALKICAGMRSSTWPEDLVDPGLLLDLLETIAATRPDASDTKLSDFFETVRAAVHELERHPSPAPPIPPPPSDLRPDATDDAVQDAEPLTDDTETRAQWSRGRTGGAHPPTAASFPDADAKLAEIRERHAIYSDDENAASFFDPDGYKAHMDRAYLLSINERAVSLAKARLCQCELSGEIHVLIDGNGCEICNRGEAFTPENVEKAFRFYQQRVEKTASEALQECERLRAALQRIESDPYLSAAEYSEIARHELGAAK